MLQTFCIKAYQHRQAEEHFFACSFFSSFLHCQFKIFTLDWFLKYLICNGYKNYLPICIFIAYSASKKRTFWILCKNLFFLMQFYESYNFTSIIYLGLVALSVVHFTILIRRDKYFKIEFQIATNMFTGQ